MVGDPEVIDSAERQGLFVMVESRGDGAAGEFARVPATEFLEQIRDGGERIQGGWDQKDGRDLGAGESHGAARGRQRLC